MRTTSACLPKIPCARALLALAIVIAPLVHASAGEKVVAEKDYYAWSRSENVTVPDATHSNFFVRLGRTLVQWPRVFSETIMGDRQFVNKRGFLGTRYEVPDDED